jgi:hypothetical protein
MLRCEVAEAKVRNSSGGVAASDDDSYGLSQFIHRSDNLAKNTAKRN